MRVFSFASPVLGRAFLCCHRSPLLPQVFWRPCPGDDITLFTAANESDFKSTEQFSVLGILGALDELTRQQRAVSASPNAGNYAPKVMTQGGLACGTVELGAGRSGQTTEPPPRKV